MHTTSLATAFTPARPLVLVGAGKMGGALVSGWLADGLDPAAVRVIDPGPPADTAAVLAKAGIAAAPALAPGTLAGALVLAVKPQMMAAVLPGLAAAAGSGTLVLSIAAGTRTATLDAAFPAADIVRAMPNTPAQIGRGISVAVGGARLGGEGRAMATALLKAAGAVEWIADEGLMDAVTAVSGSGPAYVFLMSEYLASAGVAAGLPADLADRLARATVSGAGALMTASGEDPATLRRNVTSPNGTTAAALSVLMADPGLERLLREAVAAALRRSRELAG